MVAPARLLVLLATVAALGALAGAPGAAAALFPADVLDGPADVAALGGADLARDGSGAVAWARAGEVVVSRASEGAPGPPERVDAGQGTRAAQVHVAVSDGGRTVVTWVSGGALHAATAPATGAPFGPPTLVSGGPVVASHLDVSLHGVAYVAFSAGGDVRVARSTGAAFAQADGPLDADPGASAGTGTGRPRVAAAADGTAVVVWAETGSDGRPRAWLRRVRRLARGSGPYELGVNALDGRAGLGADEPDVAVQEAASFGQVVLRQRFDDGTGHARAYGRALVGSDLGPPQPIDAQGFPAPEDATQPRVAMAGRGQGVAVSARSASGVGVVSFLRSDAFGAGAFLPTQASAAPTPVNAAVGEDDSALIGWVHDAGTPGASVRARRAEATTLGPEATLSRPELGPAVARTGGEAPAVAADAVGDGWVAFLQGPPGARRVMLAVEDRPPRPPRILTPRTPYERTSRPTIRWRASTDPWGVSYQVLLNELPIGQTRGTSLTSPVDLGDGTYRVRVVAVDRRGQSTSSSAKRLVVATRAPRARLTVQGGRLRRGRPVRFALSLAGAAGQAVTAALDFGDGTPAVRSRGGRVSHRFARAGRYVVRLRTLGVGPQASVRRTVVVGA